MFVRNETIFENPFLMFQVCCHAITYLLDFVKRNLNNRKNKQNVMTRK